jgi:bifunctional DNA-binding transcriptional regulator/antitoxin component of YhaV-PrlF toxin-antitoxin module
VIPKKKNKDGKVSENLTITIPGDIAKLKSWKKGTVLEFREMSGSVCLVEVR